MSTRLSIVMYHYVRPLKLGRFRLNGLDLTDFCEQLDWLLAHGSAVSMPQVVAALHSKADLPPNPFLLTFDDGYIDHYKYVLPILVDRGLSGAFYPPSSAIVRHQFLGVNKLHLILSQVSEMGPIISEMEAHMERLRSEYSFPTAEDLRGRQLVSSRYDSPEVTYFKRLLQHVLPPEVRRQIVDRLFERYVTNDEAALAEDFYLSVEQLKIMAAQGMHIGSHGDAHEWMDKMDRKAQRADIEVSLEMLHQVGATKDFTFCYPYGASNADTQEVLAELGCAAAVTTRAASADMASDQALLLPRWDTNDFPKRRDALHSWP